MADDPVETRFYISTGPGTAVLPVDRTQYRLTLQNCTYGIQGIPSLEFTEECAAAPLPAGDPYYQPVSLQGNFRSGQWIAVELYNLTTLETNVIFLGQIVSNHSVNLTSGCVGVGYKCQGLRRWVNEIYTSNTDYSGRVTYNLNPLDVQFIWDLSGFTLGDCIYAYLQLHRGVLAFYNVTIPTNPAVDSTSVLAQGAFVQVPQDPIVLQGRILDAIDGLLSQYAPKVAMYLDSSGWTVNVPNSNLMFVDTTTLTPTTLTLNQDPIKVSGLTGDTSNCYTCTVLRGGPAIDGALLIWQDGTSAMGIRPSADWHRGNWTWWDYITPVSSGTITGVPNTEQLVIHPTAGLTEWYRNDDGTWTIVVNGVQSIVPGTGGDNFLAQYALWFQFGFSTTLPPPYPGSVSGTSSAVFGTMYEIIDSTECRGGPATVTVSPPLSQGWSGNLTFQIRPGPLQCDPTWRKFEIPLQINGGVHDQPPGGIAGHLTKHFAPGVGYPWSPVTGTTQITTVPVSQVTCTTPAHDGFPASSTSGPQSFQIVPSQDGVTPGFILFDTPVVAQCNQIADLKLGHIPIVVSEVKVIIPYSKGALVASYPGSDPNGGIFNYAGGGSTKYGIERVYWKDYYTWVSAAQSNTMNKLAQQIAETLQDEVVDSTVNFYGFRWELMQLGQSLNVASALTTTGFEVGVLPNGIPVRSITITWPEGEGSLQVCSFHISNQRKPFQGDRHYLHPLWRRESPMMETMTRAASLNAGMLQGMRAIKSQTDDPTGMMGTIRAGQQLMLGASQQGQQAMMDTSNAGMSSMLGVNQEAIRAGLDPTYLERKQRLEGQQTLQANQQFARQLSQSQSLKQVRQREQEMAQRFAGPSLAEYRQQEGAAEKRFAGPSLRDLRAAAGPSGYQKPREREAARKAYADRLETHKTGDRMMAMHKHEDEAEARREASQENRGLPGKSAEGGESAARARQQEHIQSREAQQRAQTRATTRSHERQRQGQPGFHERRDAAGMREFPDRTRERGPGSQPQGYGFKYQAMPANPFMPGRSVAEGAGQAPLPGGNVFMPGRSVAEGAGQNPLPGGNVFMPGRGVAQGAGQNPLPGGNVFMPGEPGQTQGSANAMPNYEAHQAANLAKHQENIAQGKASVAQQRAIQAQKQDKLWWARRNKQAPMVPGFGPVDKGPQQ